MTERTKRAGRRDFLKLGALAGAAGAAASVGAPEAAQASEAAPAEGYRETEHVKTYLESCRF